VQARLARSGAAGSGCATASTAKAEPEIIPVGQLNASGQPYGFEDEEVPVVHWPRRLHRQDRMLVVDGNRNVAGVISGANLAAN
jgi:hypothetical protein